MPRSEPVSVGGRKAFVDVPLVIVDGCGECPAGADASLSWLVCFPIPSVRDRLPRLSAHEERRSDLTLPCTGLTGGEASFYREKNHKSMLVLLPHDATG